MSMRPLTVRPGQLVLTQAALALLLAGPVAVPVSGALLALAFGRLRGRWAYEWLGGRARPEPLSETVDLDGELVTLVDDGHTLAALVELADPASLFVAPPPVLPPLAGLLPRAAADVSVVVAVSVAPAYQRITIGARVRRGSGVTDDDLRRALAGALRRVRRRVGGPLRPADIPPADPFRRAFAASPRSALAVAPLPDATTTGTVVVANGPDGVRATATIDVGSPSAAGLVTAVEALRSRVDGLRPASERGGPDEPGAGPVLLSAAPGVTLGVDRLGEPVRVRLFRSGPTRVVITGGVRRAQVVAEAAAGLGGDVSVLSGRLDAWLPVLAGVGGARRPAPPSAGRPHLVLVDGASGVPDENAAWRTTVTVLDRLAPTDAALLAAADLVLLPPMTAAEARVAAGALGLGGSAEWLTRTRGDMVGVVARTPTGREIRWVLMEGGPSHDRRTPSP